MKHHLLLGFISFLTCFCFGPIVALGQGTSFTYQGRLNDAGLPATGLFDFEFRLFNAATAGSQVGATISSADVAVSNGLFTVQLDFGDSAFPGGARWLDSAVRNGTNTGAFTSITPRQPITAAPYAIFAGAAGTVTNGAIGNTQLQNNAVNAANIASGQVVKSVNGLRDDVTLSAGANVTLTPSGNTIQISSAPGNDWRLSGNTAAPGDFLGTINNVPLDLKANDARILRLEPTATSPNLIGGFSGNSILAGQSGSLVASGGRAGEANSVRESYAVVVGGYANTNSSILGFIGGGGEHEVSGTYSVIAGGFRSTAVDSGAVVGGVENYAGPGAFVGGGGGNAASLLYSVVNGGLRNKSFAAPHSVMGGGYENAIRTSGDYTIIAGGKNNTNHSSFSVIGGGGTNTVGSGSSFSTVAGGELNGIGNSAGHTVIGGGRRNFASAPYASVVGGSNNVVAFSAQFAFIGGGESNRANFPHTVVGGGERNEANGFNAVIAGGYRNLTGEQGASVGGGSHNNALGHHSTIAGGSGNEASATGTTIGGGGGNTLQSPRGTIAGGEQNWIQPGASNAFIGGGRGNLALPGAHLAAIAGGVNNSASAESATVGGGSNNDATGSWNTIRGGAGNGTSASHATVAGGWVNTASNHKAAIGGGSFNVASGFHATVPGGANNQAQGDYSLAAGRLAIAGHDGSFVWADDLGTAFSSTTNRQMALRANNGVMIQSTNRALDLRGGGSVRVAGAGLGTSTPAFIHRATAANISGNSTSIDHPHSNTDPNAILMVTPNWNPGGTGGTYNNHPIGVYYTAGRWWIFNQDLAAMPVNAAFNVLVIKP